MLCCCETSGGGNSGSLVTAHRIRIPFRAVIIEPIPVRYYKRPVPVVPKNKMDEQNAHKRRE
ncbi:RE64209p [Anopheles sinensis]|uniref:RE64209p n=1 Tax=Anopheles sinensis TaxID=74873 RepID=A0A084W6L9_ANOSI|nr:RE64209p [Anopheles sinensis]